MTTYIHPESLKVADENLELIAAVSLPGNFYFCSDACECEGNFDDDDNQDGSDAAIFKVDFGRDTYNNPCSLSLPCNGDFDCDVDVDGSDAAQFKEDFGRDQYNNPCPSCPTDPWCETYQ